jgi:hypothetical protein
MDGWMDGWMDGCLAQSKKLFLKQPRLVVISSNIQLED